ncbi:MAG: cation:proton antiporter [Porphyromonas sp.]|nr:cation:proton antiporter [Porphyromonas sp.]
MSKWRHHKDIVYYILMLLVGIGVVLFLWRYSDAKGGSMAVNPTIGEAFGTFTDIVGHHAGSSLGFLLLQVIVILVFARLVAWLFTKIGQPSVIGEILAGIVLGPSVLGWLAPDMFETLFPAESLHNISLLSQFGLIFFMFVIGMELDLAEIKKQLRKSFVIAHSGIVVPFSIGALVSLLLYEEYGGSEGTVLTFALFVGISLSVTAFPVLARIIQEQGKMKSHLGILSMSSAANGDITAWCLLAVIMAIAQAGSAMSALFTVFFAAVYMLVMFFVIRPSFAVVGEAYNTKEVAGKGVVALAFVVLLVSAYVTEILGLHALFGAFIAGVVMPNNLNFRHMMTEKIEDVSLSVFLPLFFVSSGLSTEIGLLNTATHWWITAGITLVAIVGKVGGTYAACRVVGENVRDSLYMGVLMNTRGLMELVILSMGLQLGILSPVVYAMLVIMTLVTTFMTTPAVNLLNLIWQKSDSRILSNRFHILFSFGRSQTGLTMLRIVESLFENPKESVDLVGMHLTVGSDTGKSDAEMFRSKNFEPIQRHSERAGYEVEEYYEVTDHPIRSIIKAAHLKATDLLLVGASLNLSTKPEDRAIKEKHRRFKSRFGTGLTQTLRIFNLQNLFEDRTEQFMNIRNAAVGVVVDRGLSRPAHRIAIVSDHNVEGYDELVETLTAGSQADISYLASTVFTEGRSLKSDYDLLIVPYPLWRMIYQHNPAVIEVIPTSLLLQTGNSQKK